MGLASEAYLGISYLRESYRVVSLRNLYEIIMLRWVLLISFVRFRDYLRGQIASERRSYAGITTE